MLDMRSLEPYRYQHPVLCSTLQKRLIPVFKSLITRLAEVVAISQQESLVHGKDTGTMK